MISNEFPYLLFLKMYRSELQNYATSYIERLEYLTPSEKKSLHLISVSFIQFLSEQMKQQKVNTTALEYWVKVHKNNLPLNKTQHFPNAIEYVITQVLLDIKHPQEQLILKTHSEMMEKSMHVFNHHIEQIEDTTNVSNENLQQLNHFSRILIQQNGTEDLPIILTQAEGIFSYMRCIFFTYNPWINEFSGMIGYNLPKIQQLQNQIIVDPIFNLKQPIFLKDPTTSLQQLTIETLEISSIIFIPVQHEQQLFGWISFDQKGVEFECSQDKLNLLEQAGILLGMYLSRNQKRSSMNYRLQLTEKEYAILYLLAEGFTNKEMASILYLSEFTIRDYVQKLMIKLQAKNRTQITSIAFRMGLVE